MINAFLEFKQLPPRSLQGLPYIFPNRAVEGMPAEVWRKKYTLKLHIFLLKIIILVHHFKLSVVLMALLE
jgi:hypothetical protein